MALKKAAMATPARISPVVFLNPVTVRPNAYAPATARAAPTKPARGTTLTPISDDPGANAIASVAPRLAPAAAPSRYGSASGLRKTPWYAAPAVASMPPTIAPRATRGMRSDHQIEAWLGSADVAPPTNGIG